MGQMHVQRAIEKLDGPSVVVGVDPDTERLQALEDSLSALAERAGRELVLINPAASNTGLEETVARLTGRRGGG